MPDGRGPDLETQAKMAFLCHFHNTVVPDDKVLRRIAVF